MKVDISLPTDIAIKNIGEEVTSFRYFGVNFVQKLNAGEEFVISGASSEATAYYLAQADENKSLQVLVNETNGNETEPVAEEPTKPTEPTEPKTTENEQTGDETLA